MDHRPPKLRKDHLVELARSVFGSAKWATWQVGLLVIVFLTLLNLFSNSIYDIFRGQFHCSQPIYILLFAFSVFLIFWLAEEAAARVNLDIVQTDNPQQCRALILFLSPPGKDEQWMQQALKEGQLGDITNEATRKRFEGSWRMPIEAIAYHLTRLDKVVILPSADSPDQENGTFRHCTLIADIVHKLTQEKKPIRPTGLHEIDSRWDRGVDYEIAQALVEALHQAFQWLGNQGIKDQDILVDITGGQKVPTVAGAAAALGRERWFQYVSTRDYKVRAYDITYRATTDF